MKKLKTFAPGQVLEKSFEQVFETWKNEPIDLNADLTIRNRFLNQQKKEFDLSKLQDKFFDTSMEK